MAPFLAAAALIPLLLLLLVVVLLRRRVRSRGKSLGGLRSPTGAQDAAPMSVEARVAAIVASGADADDRAELAVGALASLVEALPIGVLRVDDDLLVQSANRAADAIADRAPGSMVGRSVIEAFVEPRIEEIAAAAGSGVSAGGEVRLAGSEARTLLVHAQGLSSGGRWLVIQDVSELRRLERIRTEFVDNLSHELRTPLTTVSLLIETLSRDAEVAGDALDPKMRDRISKVEVETGHLVQMVNELLDLARIESGEVVALVDEIDMGALARGSAERLRPFAERQGVTLDVDVSAGLPAVRGDEGRIGQVLVNLLHNAVKFSPDGGPVVIQIRHEGGEVVTSVADHGIGIRRADQARIFERFYKADRARVRGGGTGLGLAIARHIVEGHGGRIRVVSEEGRGSTFSFALPVSADAGASQEGAGAAPR